MSVKEYKKEKDEDKDVPQADDVSEEASPAADIEASSPVVADSTSTAPQTPSPVAETVSPATQAPSPDQAMPQAPAAPMDQTQAPAAEAEAEAAPTQAEPAAQNLKPSATIDVIGHQPPAQNALQAYAEDMAFHQDLHDGQIHPETYQSLFAKKDTLGKIGTIFGLLLSGAGSGLAHQPNALLDMMDNQIKNDLEAQKLNQGNKQTWYNAALAHEKHQSEIQLNQAIEDATRMGTWSKGLENEFNNWKNSTLPGLQRLGATASAYNSTLNGYLQHQQDNINRLAPGPMRDRAQALLDGQVKPVAFKMMLKNREDAAQHARAILQLKPNPLTKAQQQPSIQDLRIPAVDMREFNKRMLIGRQNPLHPLAIPPEQVPEMYTEIKDVGKNRSAYADTADAFQKLQALKMAGQVPFKNTAQAFSAIVGAGLGSSLGPMGAAAGSYLGQIVGKGAEEAASIFERERNIQKEKVMQRLPPSLSEEERKKRADAMLPSWQDSDHSTSSAWDAMTQHFKSSEYHQFPALENSHLLHPFKEAPFVSTDKIREDKASKRHQMSPTNANVDWSKVKIYQ